MSDPIKPNAKCVRGLEFRQPSMHGHPDGLEDIEGSVGFAEYFVDKVEQPFVVPIEKPGKCIAITLLRQQNRQALFDCMQLIKRWHRPAVGEDFSRRILLGTSLSHYRQSLSEEYSREPIELFSSALFSRYQAALGSIRQQLFFKAGLKPRRSYGPVGEMWLMSKKFKARHGDGPTAPFICSVQAHRVGEPLQRHVIRRRFLSACKILGPERLRTLTIHHSRHRFISHALAGGRTLAEVRAAAGHSNVAVTSVYLHVVVDEREAVGDLFGM